MAVAAVCVLGVAAGVPAVADVVKPDTRLPVASELPEVKGVDVVLSREESLLTLSVQDESGATKYALLNCRPPVGSHPEPRKACEQLRAAGGFVTAIPAESGACTTEYAPVTVIAKGTWQGYQMSYRGRHDNRCEAIRKTGGVLFNF